MTTKSFLDCERQRIAQMGKFQLPNQFKKLGFALVLLGFLSLIFNKFSLNLPEMRSIGKYAMLLGLLLVSISKEQIEDERIRQLRGQSYAFAFILGVAYALCLPFVDYFVDYVFKSGEAVLKDMGDFEILWILLSIQVLYFEFLKRIQQ